MIINIISVLNKQTGVEATICIRQLGYDKMIVGLTGNALEEDVAEFEAAGADFVLSKPLKMELLDSLLEFIDRCGTSRFHNKHMVLRDDRFQWI